MTLSEMLERNARTFPDKTALIERTPSLNLRVGISWKNFNERVNRLANGLMDRGVRKGDRVVIWMLNSLNWLEAYLGILRTGAWAVPLNHRFTSREFGYCMDIAEPRAMFLDKEFVAKVEAVGRLFCPVENIIVAGADIYRRMTGFEDMVFASSADRQWVLLHVR